MLIEIGPIAGNTAHPLLLLNPTLDAVTPIAKLVTPIHCFNQVPCLTSNSAHVTATLFNGSVVLEQNSEGVSYLVSQVLSLLSILLFIVE